MNSALNIWFPTIRANSGSDIYTIRLCEALNKAGIQANITWFSHLYELAPFLMSKTKVPRKTNIIHTSSWTTFAFRQHGLPLVSTLHHNVFEQDFLPYKTHLQSLYHNLLIRPYENASLKSSTHKIAVSHHTSNSYAKTYQIKKPDVIPNWVNTDIFTPAKQKHKNQTFKLLFIGNHSLRKGSDLLKPILSKLGKGYELHTTGGLRGSNSKNSQHNEFIHHPNISNTKKLVSLYQSCDVLLFPSRLEGFGLAALEAQACGLPVIATNTSAFPEVVSNNSTGILCPKDDIDMFVESIKELKNNPEKMNLMKLNARKHAVKNYSEEDIIQKYISLYKKLLNPIESELN